MTFPSRVIVACIFIITLGLLVNTILKKFNFSEILGKKYTRQDLVENFMEHQNEFADLESYFNAHVPYNSDQTVRIELNGSRKVGLTIYHDNAEPIGGYMEINSPKMDTMLALLGWTKEIVLNITEKLSKINCEQISSTHLYGGEPIDIYLRQRGLGSYNYFIYKKPLSDSLIKYIGKPLTDTGLGSRVVISYTAPL